MFSLSYNYGKEEKGRDLCSQSCSWFYRNPGHMAVCHNKISQVLVHQIAVYQVHKFRRNPILLLYVFVSTKAAACWKISNDSALLVKRHTLMPFFFHIPQTKRPERHMVLVFLHSEGKLIWCSVVVWKEARQLKKGICRMYTIGLMFANPRALNNTDLHLYDAGFGWRRLGRKQRMHNICKKKYMLAYKLC